jgi:hypothetical protein
MSLTRLALVLLAFVPTACSAGASVRRVRLWEGDGGCTSCANVALDVTADHSSTVDLIPDSMYTVEIELRHPEETRCAFRPLRATWRFNATPREFDCLVEQEFLRLALSTRRDALAPAPAEDMLSIVVDEYSIADRHLIATLFKKDYVVRWMAR